MMVKKDSIELVISVDEVRGLISELGRLGWYQSKFPYIHELFNALLEEVGDE